MATTREVGDGIEQQAANYLQTRGMRLVARQVRYKSGEIDLLMEDRDDTLVFVEVRYRRNISFGDGADSVNWTKRHRLRRAAELYLALNPLASKRACRFDVISACGRVDQPQWNWFRNAFTLN